MTSVKHALLAILLLALSSSIAAASGQQEFDSDLFLSLERSLLTASALGDRAMLEHLVAPDFVLRANPDVDRGLWMKSLLTGCWIEHSDIDRFVARPVGNTVATSFMLTLYRDPDTCRGAVMRSLVTSVWVFNNDHWQIVLRQMVPPGTVAGQWTKQQFSRESEQLVKLDGKAQLSFLATTGNATTQTIGTGGELNYRTPRWGTGVKSNFVSTRTDRGVARSVSFDVRESYSRPSRVEMYVHGAFLRDEFAGISERYTADVGVGLPILRRKASSLKFDVGLGYIKENRFVSASPAFPTGVQTIIYSWTISPGSSLSNEIRTSENLNHVSDWRLADSLSVNVGLSRLLALKISHKLNYLNQPVPGFHKTDTVTSIALVLQFAR